MYDLAFTTGFHKGLDGIPEDVIKILNRFLGKLRENPFQSLPQAKRLRNARGRYRARIAGDYRAIYRIDTAIQRIVLLTIASRQSVYDRPPGGEALLEGEQARDVEERLQGSVRTPTSPTAPAPALSLDAPADQDTHVEVEPVAEWITEDELYLLRIEHAHHEAIIDAADGRSINPDDVPQEVIDRVIDYVTNPASSQIGKLYSLQGADEIARRPLRDFMLALDREQQRVINRDLKSGPLLIKGGPGTGKSLVGLYRMRHIIENRASESMFVSHPRFGILTYTNTLADLNGALLEELKKKVTQGDHAGDLECSTLDKVTFHLAKEALARQPNLINEVTAAKLLEISVLPNLSAEHTEIIERYGMNFAVDEIERVILGFGVDTIDEYLKIPRTNRKVRLNERARRAFWSLYEGFLHLHQIRRIESWGLLRKLALDHLRKSENFPRYSALFVDEVQDLSRTARRLVVELVSDPRFLMMTADTGQSIYEVPPTWAETDPRLNVRGGRTFVLRRNYRTTREIYRAIEPLRIESDDGEGATGRPMPVFSGERPVWLSSSSNQQAECLVETIATLAARHGPGQIAIIVRDHAQMASYNELLAARSVKVRPIVKGNPIQLEGAHVHLITAHSSKGLEFPAVIVPNVSDTVYPAIRGVNAIKDPAQLEEVLELEQRLLYVALSRACHTLVMIADDEQPSRFLSALDPSAWRDSV